MSTSTSSNDAQYPHVSLTRSIIGAFYEVYNAMGYGFLEAVYVNAMVVALTRRGLGVHREWPIKVRYDGVVVGEFRADLVCEGQVLLEVKSSAQLPPIALGQVMNYVRATNIPVGLLLHFGPKPSVKRVVNTAPGPREERS